MQPREKKAGTISTTTTETLKEGEECPSFITKYKEGPLHPRTETPLRSSRHGRDSGGDAECVDLLADPLLGSEELRWIQSDQDFYRKGERVEVDLGKVKMEMMGSWGLLQKLGRDQTWRPSKEDNRTWKERLIQDLPDPEGFRAGRLGEHAEVLEDPRC